ncbi:MAG: xanthine dehydrogenase family protein [Acidimicrobiales bacterium]|nr:xanthine dehydrogenase family protein [Acidimicrobiales bacterium]MCB9393386.1 xanthine dehydrogenase family protein [Acidimicrobiaceae bacterium]
MTAPWVGRRMPRVEDERLLRGLGRYVDDLTTADAVHATVVRSPVAHGVLTDFRVAEVPAGSRVLGPDELAAMASGRFPILWWVGDQLQRHTPLVDRHLRYVGQPVAVVVAPSRAEAEDVAASIELDIDTLPAVVDPESALAPGAPLLYPELGTNAICTFEVGDTAEHTDAVFAAADHVRSTRIRIGRATGLPMENRGVLAVPEADGRLTVHTSTQAVHAVRDVLCEVTGLPHHRVRVVAPDVGGGFGLKDHLYEDEVMVVLAALATGSPVHWTEDRTEAMLATTHARDEMHHVDVAFDDDGTLRGLRVRGLRNAGGRLSVFGGGPMFVSHGMSPGQYRWDAVRGEARVVATTTMSTGAYRGFGQTQAAMIRERAVELVAEALGRHPAELREQNMIEPHEQPYTSRTFVTYDNGDYRLAVRRARALIEAGPPAPDDGRRRAIGYCSYVQLAGIGPSKGNEAIGVRIGGFETSDICMTPDGSVVVATGVSPHGQGHQTTFAQLVADELGIDPGRVRLHWGDTDSTPYSAYGTAASRSIAVGGGAAVSAGRRIAAKLRSIAAHLLEASPDDIVLRDGRATVAGTQVSVSIDEVAHRAWLGMGLPDGETPGLHERVLYDPPSATFSYATHACRVAVDPDTGQVEVEDYVVVNDCGTIVNPTIVEGQIHGGVAQGLGAALMEHVVYDDEGQLRSATLLDYHVPVTATMPDVRIENLEIPSPHTPGGMKGMGEGGTNGAFACVVNAVLAAVPELRDAPLVTPLTPARVWAAIHR